MNTSDLHLFEDIDLVRYMQKLRTFEREDGALCFIAKDVCDGLGITNTSRAISLLDDDEKGKIRWKTEGGARWLSYVTESGFYTVLFRSSQAMQPGTMAYRFRKNIDKVLDQLFETGSVSVWEKGTLQ